MTGSRSKDYWPRKRSTRQRRRIRQEAARLAALALADLPAGATPSSPATSNTAPQASGGNGGRVETALFQRPSEIRSDARLCRIAMKKEWQPTAAMTRTVIEKATELALRDTTKLEGVVAVAKLHLDAHKQVQIEEQNDDRYEFNERVFEHKKETGSGAVPLNVGVGVRVGQEQAGNDVSVLIYLPDNGRDPDNRVVPMPDFQDS